jgi:quinol monooxygenase YgiN
MAITINIYYTGKHGNARKFAGEMVSNGVVDDIRAEKGNISDDTFRQADQKKQRTNVCLVLYKANDLW